SGVVVLSCSRAGVGVLRPGDALPLDIPGALQQSARVAGDRPREPKARSPLKGLSEILEYTLEAFSAVARHPAGAGRSDPASNPAAAVSVVPMAIGWSRAAAPGGGSRSLSRRYRRAGAGGGRG